MKYYLLAILTALPSIVTAQEVYTTFNRSIPFISGELNTANFAEALFNIAIAIAAILVVVRLVLAGSKYMLSGLVTSKESAKQEIRDALIGLLIILASVTVLQTINPQLLNLNALGTLQPATTTIPTFSGAYVVGTFSVGESKSASEVIDFCGQESQNRDELCIRRVEAGLAEKCLESGGVSMEKRSGPPGWNGVTPFVYYCD